MNKKQKKKTSTSGTRTARSRTATPGEHITHTPSKMEPSGAPYNVLHVCPPYAGTPARVNVRLWVPLPQLAEQVVNAPQLPTQSIGHACVLHAAPD